MTARSDDLRPSLIVFRCPKCGSVLARLMLVRGSVVEIKCKKCKTVVTKQAA